MSTTFNGLVLDELGTIGNPQVEYANFIATTASPAGYDGAVLKNFKRDYTTIKFDLTLAGTESECLNKLNTLVGALNAGQGELVMPGQAERGTHFNAVPNMKIAHSLRGFDGMTVPCTFIVPEGCAVKEARHIVPKGDTLLLENDEAFEMHLTISGETVDAWQSMTAEILALSARAGTTLYNSVLSFVEPYPRPTAYDVPAGLTFEYDTRTYAVKSNYNIISRSATNPPVPGIKPGESIEYFFFLPGEVTGVGVSEIVIMQSGRYVW